MRFSQIGSISDAVEYTAEQRKESSKTFSSKKRTPNKVSLNCLSSL